MDEDDDLDEDERDPDNRRNRLSFPPSPFSLLSHPPPLNCTGSDLDSRIQRDDEYSDSEDEGMGGRRDRKSHKKSQGNQNVEGPRRGGGATSSVSEDQLGRGRRPSVRPEETVPGVKEGEDVVMVFEQAKTSGERKTIEREVEVEVVEGEKGKDVVVVVVDAEMVV